MSSTLYWEPANRKAHVLGAAGILSLNDTEYLRGLQDAEVEGATCLIEAIEKYGEISVFEE